MITQKDRDAGRTAYTVVFPSTMKEEHALAWMRSIGGNLDNGLGALVSRPTIVLEMRGENFALEHRIRFPAGVLTKGLIKQLRSQIPGVSVLPTPDDRLEPTEWTYGVEIQMTNGARSLRMNSITEHSNKILTAASSLDEGERVVLSWVVSHTGQIKMPPAQGPLKKSRNSVPDALLGNIEATPEERQDRRVKTAEPCFKAVGRIAAYAKTVEEAKEIVDGIEHMLCSENAGSNYFRTKRKSPAEITRLVNDGVTPAQFTTQLSISELLGVSGWPIDGPNIAGLPNGPSKQLPPDPSILADGIPLGSSNFPGGERRLAYDPESACRHTYIPGVNGVGKTTLMLNMFKTVVSQGHGAIIFDTKKDIALGAIDYVPAHRLDDVIYVNFADHDHPIGFNPLDQGRPLAVTDEIVRLLYHVYRDIRGVNVRQQLHHGLRALAEASEAGDKQYTILDLMPLLNPQTPTEKAWSKELIRGLKDRALKRWFAEWEKLDDRTRNSRLEALDNRFWQFDRPELRNVIGQSKSAFQMDDVILKNKILIVNMVGMNDDAMELAAVLLFNSLWGSVRAHTPAKENFLFLDEFADIINIPVDYESMLAKARIARLAMILANQEFGQLTPEMKSALMANAVTKVVFKLSSSDGATIANEFGRNKLSSDDFINLDRHQAIARVATPGKGVSPPVTLTTHKPFPEDRLGHQVIARSRQLALSPEDVEVDEMRRRMPSKPLGPRRPQGEGPLTNEGNLRDDLEF